ncbi:MAG TPA: cell division protein ZapA [Bacteroidales bacterium]|nr:cell division protein ZapA [Bacteroidales bacterium]
MKETVRTVHVNQRPYKITVSDENEELILNKSVKLVNGEIETFLKNVKGRDRHDMLAMASLDIAARYINLDEERLFISEELNSRLEALDKLLDENI